MNAKEIERQYKDPTYDDFCRGETKFNFIQSQLEYLDRLFPGEASKASSRKGKKKINPQYREIKTAISNGHFVLLPEYYFKHSQKTQGTIYFNQT